ncbi:MAG: squalene--hopene cyclase [Acidimicrobiales bacterium]
MTTVNTSAPPAIDVVLQRGCEALLRTQHPDGWWKGILDTNVTMDAEDLMLRHVLGVLTPAQLAGSGAWVRSQQRADGTWATFHGGPGDLSTTVEAYVALRLAGDSDTAEHMRSAAAFIREQGGLDKARVFTRFWLALCGAWSWDELPALPPEVILLPPWFPLNIYDFACWARQTIVPLTVVASKRPVQPLPFTLDELRVAAVTPAAQPSLRTTKGKLLLLDRVLRRYERRPLKFLRRRAWAKAERWVIERQEADGSWGGIQPPWVYSILALHLLGYSLDHPVLMAAFDGLDRFTVIEHGTRRLEACQSPVWDTAFAVIALSDAGYDADHPALLRAGRWLNGEEITKIGDWAVRRPGVAAGGWAFEFENDNYPDIDDTCEVVLALKRIDHPGVSSDAKAAIDRAVAWVVAMQCRDGGWAAFDADNTRQLCRELPFCDFGAVIDPPSADVTAHAVEMLAALGERGEPFRRGLDWLWAAQEPDGSWFGRWGANHVYGTGHVVPALAAAGVPSTDPRLRRAMEWLRRHQNTDGGWGEDLRSYRDSAWIGRGDSTASQTAWALLALLAAAEPSAENNSCLERGLAFLAGTQRPDGTWDEPLYTGTGFPGDFYINYHLYRQVFPLMALGRAWKLRSADA